MKIKDIFSELIDLAKRLNVKIITDKGKFRTGYAVVNNSNTILINSGVPIETKASYLAKALNELIDVNDCQIPMPVKLFLDEEAVNQKEQKVSIDLTK